MDENKDNNSDGLNTFRPPLMPSERENEDYEPVNPNFPINKKTNKFVKKRLPYIIGFLFFIVLIGGLVEMVKPITAIVGAVQEAGVAASNVANDFLERAKNLLKYGDWGTNEQTLLDKIEDEAKGFGNKFGKKLNIPLVAATLFYDGSVDETREVITEDGNKVQVSRISNEKLDKRLEYIDEIIERLIAIKEHIYRCDYKKSGDTGQFMTTFVSSDYVDEKDEEKDKISCDDFLLPDGTIVSDKERYIYTYIETYDLEGYEHRLKYLLEDNGMTIIELLFPEKVAIEGVDNVIQDILDYYETWLLIYGEDDEDIVCYSPGTIPPEFLIQISPPFKGEYVITSRYGSRPNPLNDGGPAYEFHNGIDIVAREDKTIYAVNDGVVHFSGYDERAGNYIVIEHDFGGKKLYSQYMHMVQLSQYSTGQKVSKGTAIGEMGSTGRSTGAHLHFGLFSYGGTSNGKTYINPENLFSEAENYKLNCTTKPKPINSCSLEGGVALYSFKSKYNFDLMRAIMKYENYYLGSSVLLTADFDMSYFSSVYERNKGKFPEYDNKINFETMMVESEGTVLSFADPLENAYARGLVLEYLGKMDKNVYDNIKIGFSLIPSSMYKQFGFKSSQEMYEIMNENKFEYVQAVFEYAVMNNPNLEQILSLQTEITDAQISEVLKGLYSHIPSDSSMNKFVNKPDYVKMVTDYYKEFIEDPDSSVENYMSECLIIPIPGWEDCITYEKKDKCKNNIKTNIAAATWYTETAPTVAGKRVLAYAMSLWGKVRYCGACGIGSDPECIDIKPDGTIGKHAYKYGYSAVRCSPWAHAYYNEGFNPKWSTLHSYTYKGTPYYKNDAALENGDISYKNDGGTFNAGLAGLDCAGFVNWVLNHTFQVFTHDAFPIMSTVCNAETDYTVSTQFENVPEYAEVMETGTRADKKNNFGNTILPRLMPGDILCNSTSGKYSGGKVQDEDTFNYSGNDRHVMIFMGYEDINLNGIADSEDELLIIHSSTGGVVVDRKKANQDYWLQLNSYATYK